MTRSSLKPVLLTGLTLFLAACQPVANAASVGMLTPEGSSATDIPITSTPSATPQTPTATPTLVPTPIAVQETGSNTLRFVFPTPGPQPNSAWRPPLYDVPWSPGPYDHFYFSHPIAADEVNWPLADYRYGGMFPGTDTIHTGIDIDAPIGTPVLAAAEGRVVWAGYGLYRGEYSTQDPYGLAVAILHDFGYQDKHLWTVYAHMSKINVVVGQNVTTGEAIGNVGATGNVTGPHLHFEVRVEDNDYFDTRNPELWLAPPQGWGVLVGRLTNPDGSYANNHEVLVKDTASTRQWVVRTYGPQAVNNDPYYRENMVLSDLPAGYYTVNFLYSGVVHKLDVQINPGQVTYFTFHGWDLANATPDPPNDLSDFATPAP
jgi:murein DD-endopeptidase MepM/ murein hydrolase activator NlpD